MKVDSKSWQHRTFINDTYISVPAFYFESQMQVLFLCTVGDARPIRGPLSGMFRGFPVSNFERLCLQRLRL